METYAAPYATALEALADPTRRSLFELLRRRPRSVGGLADELPISRPAVSQHLKVLKTAGLVTARPEGTQRIYSIAPNGLGPLRAYVEELWDSALDAFAEALESEQGGEE